MSEFKRHRLGDLYEISSGISTTKDQAGHGAPFVAFKDIYNNYFIPERLTELMDTTPEQQEKFSVRQGDVFLTRTSETLDELAMSSVALQDHPNATFSGFAIRQTQTHGSWASFCAASTSEESSTASRR